MKYVTSAGVLALCAVANSADAQSTSPPLEASQAEAATAAAETDPRFGDIVVTASKREEKLRDVPSAITVFSGEDLANLGVRSVRDYATLTPGLTVQESGTPGYGKIFIRGLTTGALQQSATSVYYIDDVPFTASSANGGGSYIAPDPELVDIDRIEVLKGPQGTLYGASSLGGVIRLISKKPDSTRLSGSARAEMTAIDGGGVGGSVSASLNLPLVTDHLAVRATGFYRKAPGYVDNIGTGTDNVNRSITKGGRVAIGWEPSDRFSLDIAGQFQNIDTRGLAYQDNVNGTLTPFYGKRTYSNFFNAPTTVRYRLASITGKYDVGFGQVIATGAYLKSKLHFESDVTPSYAALLPVLGYPAGTGVATTNSVDLEKKTAELRFASNRLGPVEFIVGGFYTNEHGVLPTNVVTRNMATNTPLPEPLGTLVSVPINDRYEEVSAFGNLTFYLSDNLDVTGGVRYAHHKEDFTLSYSGLLYGGTVEVPSTHSSNNQATYLATLRWRPTRTLSAFLRAASGYRPGGPQTAAFIPPGGQTMINPDTVWNYEAGIKSSFLDNRLEIEASAYHIDWKNIQLYTVFQNFQLLANAGKAKVDGFEIQAVARPTKTLTISANGGHSNARITDIDPGVTALIGASAGDRSPQTPRWTGSATVDQLIPLGGDIQGQLGATLRLQSAIPSSFPGSLVDRNVKLPSINTLDLRVGVQYQRFNLQLRAENIFDRNGVSSYVAGTGTPFTPTPAFLIRPRSFTLSLSANF